MRSADSGTILRPVIYSGEAFFQQETTVQRSDALDAIIFWRRFRALQLHLSVEGVSRRGRYSEAALPVMKIRKEVVNIVGLRRSQ